MATNLTDQDDQAKIYDGHEMTEKGNLANI